MQNDIPYYPMYMLHISQLLKGTTPLVILASLHQEERYGYDIIQAIKQASGDHLALGEGSVYPILHALERDKYIKSRWVIQEKGPARKYYALTAKGKKACSTSAQQWKSFSLAVSRATHAFGV